MWQSSLAEREERPNAVFLTRSPRRTFFSAGVKMCVGSEIARIMNWYSCTAGLVSKSPFRTVRRTARHGKTKRKKENVSLASPKVIVSPTTRTRRLYD